MKAGPSCLYSCDWGTSSFRLRLVRTEDGGIIEEVASALGAKTLASQLARGANAGDRAAAFHDYLSSQLEAMAARHPKSAMNAPVIVSGMASSSVGWRELPYAAVPFPVRCANCKRPRTAHPCCWRRPERWDHFIGWQGKFLDWADASGIWMPLR